MADGKVFCNVPWTNLHIYWDGSFGACCYEKHRPYPDGQTQTYNIKNMSVADWFNTEPMRAMRQQIHGSTPLSNCESCYRDEELGNESRRVKENFKSVIFTEQSFERSFEQGPMRSVFYADHVSSPIDWHVDLGNECNLACKMCIPAASSKIAAQYRRWNLIPAEQSIFQNWTEDDTAWDNFLTSIVETKHLNRLHFMGGEPLLNRRFESLLDFLLEHKPGLSLSFVTNGTIYNQKIIDKLLQFESCDLEISIESFDNANDYIRQGSTVSETVANIERILAQTNDKFKLVLRSVPQLLNVHSYDKYLQWCLDHQVAVQSIPLKNPGYLKISVLPQDIKQQLIEQYESFKISIQQLHYTTLVTGRDATKLPQQIIRECDSVLHQLRTQPDANVAEQRIMLAQWLTKWDTVYKLNALDYYPRYKDFLLECGYGKL